MVNLLQIDSWYGGGKSILRGLLDGHSQIAVNPIHDATQMTFLNKELEEILNYRDLEKLRRKIGAFSQYYVFEKEAFTKKLHVAFSSDVTLEPGFDFDFYRFDKSWVATLLTKKEWSPEVVMDCIYEAFIAQLYDHNDHKYFATMSWSIPNKQKLFTSVFPNGKTILVKRDILDIVATRARRKPMTGMVSTQYSPGFEKVIASNEIRQIKNYYSYYEESEKNLPNQFHVVSFDDLIHNRSASIQKICEFLDLQFEPAMLKWSIFGKEIKYDGVGYADQVNDKYDILLTKQEIERVNDAIHKSDNPKPKGIGYKALMKISSLSNKIAKTIEGE